MELKVKIAGVELKNPIITASGTFGFGREYANFYDISKLGGICTKAITRQPRAGNNGVRVAETASGMLNCVGLQNPGVEVFLSKDAPNLEKLDTCVIVNVAGSTIEDYCQTVEMASAHAATDMIELNISCPNVKKGGMTFGVDPKSAEQITAEVRKYCKKPLIVKLSPNVSSITDIARAVESAGADAVSLINTVSGMAIDYRTRKPILGNVVGGLSGPCIKPVALKMVHEVYKAVKIPIIGLGGIQSAEDVAEFLIAGASAVQIGTANFYDPLIGLKVVNELTNVLKSCKIDKVSDLIGTLTY